MAIIFQNAMFLSELIYTILVVVICFAIHYKTKESYELTKHEGIKHFRNAFLLFGYSYVVRLLFSLVMFSTFTFDLILPRQIAGVLFILPMSFLSTLAIFYLLASSFWKNFTQKQIQIFGLILAALLAVVSVLTNSNDVLTLLQFAFLIIYVAISFVTESKVFKVKTLSLLVFIFWIASLWALSPRPRLPLELLSLLQLMSLLVLAAVYVRLSKWV